MTFQFFFEDGELYSHELTETVTMNIMTYRNSVAQLFFTDVVSGEQVDIPTEFELHTYVLQSREIVSPMCRMYALSAKNSYECVYENVSFLSLVTRPMWNITSFS